MKILNILKKEILENFRDKKAMLLMTLFPMLLITILGTVFSGNFASTINIPEINVMYSINKDVKIDKNFKDFTKEIQKNMKVNFKETKEEKDALEKISNGKADVYIKIPNDKKIYIYENNVRVFNSQLVSTLLDTFVDKVNMTKEVSSKNPMALSKIKVDNSPNFVNTKTIDGKNSPRGIDYYAVTMLTMTILYGTAVGAMSIASEIKRRTYKRLICSNTSPLKILFSKILASFLVIAFQSFLIYLFSKYILGTNWGNNKLALISVVASLIFMAVSAGVCIANTIKNEGVMSIIIYMFVPVLTFLGGGYIPLDTIGSKMLNYVSNISPLKWSNDAIFKIIFGNDLSIFATTMLINLGAGVLFLLIAMLFPRKDVV
ncbi:SagG family ABC transporter permease subunit [Clostridium botulinum]|uniref:SagG family ABC transporter permease subunit n=1 Tax=Clostridium botulinum TaxID=1491 RepID=UPI00016BAEDC|nr:SagG family ABC transporter permease subunit [Clostridium botulinum]APC79916.1 ABC-2 type transporter family protein [Clostridium botulinum]APC85085.1 ABC-2 type transporter family protein [Clostridium botulinum]APH22909.1 ABC-2 type transporter family protein [Clostridium botulinum]APQ68792.1 ABC-2 type transporter family protein [Clostridium botulinum]APQ76861.1 ABC-2 type transporter family protein [Clostridium botulinum]